MPALPTISQLFDLLSLDPETGVLTWRVAKRGIAAGTRAGYECPTWGYRLVRINGSTLREHRVVFAMVHGRWPIGDVDHINRNKVDNRPCNLREATRSLNNCNSKVRSDSQTGIKGVHFHKKRNQYRAYCKLHGKETHLGWFGSAQEAAEAASRARAKMHGEFARD